MTDDPINISQTPLPYSKRRTSTFRWTLFLYFILAIAAGLSTELGAFLYFIFFLTIIFALDYSRRLNWVQYALVTLDADINGVRLSYYDKAEIKSQTISWDKLKISKGSTFTRGLTRILTIKDGDIKIASFYADDNLDNIKINDLYKNLKDLKTAYA